ncbi:response regulator [Roseovarius sp.]|uniref:response regulator n=1 Tax=Roseovarius sp. TaxID=1486281 RepID=UPI003A98194F
MKILAIDDNESILSLLEHALAASDAHDVTLAYSAREALEAIDRANVAFDCLLIDIQMPDVDGIDLTKLIRKTPGYQHQPILMLTAMHEKAYLDKAFKAGATDYVSKPFDFKDLQSRIFDAQSLTSQRSARLAGRISMEQTIKWSRGIAKDEGSNPVIDYADADGFIEYGEFDNYVLELARGRGRKATLIALKVADPTLKHPELSLAEFSAMLRDVATCMRACCPDLVSAMSYRGNGTLVCVMEKQMNLRPEMIETEINGRFLAVSSTARTSDVKVFLGEPVPLRAKTDTGVLDILWSAIDSVEQRFVAKKETAGMAKRLLKRTLLSEEQHRIERKAYKLVMRDMLSEMNDGPWSKKLCNRLE